ncbi:hypothetical protein ACWEGE_21290 [Amycolatopsis sp. NPDC004747]
MKFGKATARRVLVAAVAVLAFVAGNAVVSGTVTSSAGSGPVPVGSPTPTHHGRGAS